MTSISLERTVLVSGAAGGIGSELVRCLSGAGWKVIATDMPSANPGHSLTGSAVAWIPQDLAALHSSEALLDAFVAQVLKAAGSAPLKGIVHNAAVQRLGAYPDLTGEDWQQTMQVNVLAPVAMTRALLPLLQRHRGSVVHIGSIHSQLTKAGFTAYATSKAALAGLTRAMAVELGGSVRVNAIEPAAIATPMLEAGFAHAPDRKAQLEAFHPTGFIGNPADVARAVLFLLDPANAFLNGCVLPLGGGIHSRLHDPA